MRTLQAVGGGLWGGMLLVGLEVGMLASAAHARQVQLWDMGTGELVRTLEGCGRACHQLGASLSDGLLASNSGANLCVWEVATRRLLWTHTNICVNPSNYNIFCP